MLIFICDDDQVSLNYARETLEQYAARSGSEIAIQEFLGREALQQYTGEEPTVIFMDILMKGVEGIDAAAEMNERWPDCCIVYLTDYLVFATEVYRTEHIFFVLKEQFPRRVEEIMGKVLQRLDMRKKSISLHSGTQTFQLSPKEILYFERTLRQTRIITDNGEYQALEKLPDIMKLLPEGSFTRCHNSYIVSFQAVRSMQADSFTMKDGTVISISRAYRKAVRLQFERWAVTQL